MQYQDQDFYSQEHVSNSNDDGRLTIYANYADNTDIAASLELKEAIGLLIQSFQWAAESVFNSGRNSRRRLYVLYWTALAPNIRLSRKRVSERLSVKIHTLDKDIAFCKSQLERACIVHHLPPSAFQNLVNALAKL